MITKEETGTLQFKEGFTHPVRVDTRNRFQMHTHTF